MLITDRINANTSAKITKATTAYILIKQLAMQNATGLLICDILY